MRPIASNSGNKRATDYGTENAISGKHRPQGRPYSRRDSWSIARFGAESLPTSYAPTPQESLPPFQFFQKKNTNRPDSLNP
jgi:hypothetical protein